MSFVLLSIGSCVLYTLACYGTGLVFYQAAANWFGESVTPRPSWFLVSIFLLGSALLANLWLVLLSLSVFYKWLVFLCVLLSAVYGAHQLWSTRGGIREHLKDGLASFFAETTGWKIITMLTLLAVVQTAAVCFAPLEYNGDAAAFYMVLPKLLAESKTLESLPGYESFMTIGLHGELHFAALMMMGAEWGAKFFTWPIGVACGLTLMAITRQVGATRRAGILALICVFTSTAFILLIGDGKTDLFGAALGCGAFYWLLMGDGQSKGPQFFIAGIFAGSAIIAKISYLPLMVPAVFLFILWRQYTQDESLQTDAKAWLAVLFRNYLSVIIGALLPFIVHLFKNWVLFSEPFAPFFYFGADPFSGNWANQSWFAPEAVRKIILTYPLALIFGKYPMQYGNLSVLLLAFLPAMFVLPRRPRIWTSTLFQLSVIGLLGIIIWVVLRPGVFAPRYILYTLLLLIPAVVVTCEWVMANESAPRLMSGVIVGVCVFYLAGFNVILAKKTADRFHENPARIALEQASARLNDAVGGGERVLSLTYFTYWLRPDILRSMSSTTEKQNIGEFESAETALDYMHTHGFRYVLIDHATHSQFQHIFGEKQTLSATDIKVLFKKQNFTVLEMTPSAPSA